MKKIKVTRATRKVPWYEKPYLLFPAIGLALVGLGLLMAHLSGLAREKTLEAETVHALPAAQQAAQATPHVLEPGSPLPPAGPGELLPPLKAGTRAEAEAAREACRRARGIERAGQGPGGYGFVDAQRIAAAAAGLGAEPARVWSGLPLSPQQRTWCDYELQQSAGGETILVAFVPVELAEALGALAPALELPEPDPDAAPGWQFWRKKDEGEAARLHRGSRIELYPDVNPGAECLVALPAERIVPRGARSAHTGLSTPVEVLEVELR